MYRSPTAHSTATPDTRSENSFVDVQGLRIAYKTFGDGVPVVYLHGFATTSATWSLLLRLLPSNLRHVFFDLPGHGESSRLSAPETRPELLSDILRSAIESKVKDRFILVGHSYGALLALMMAISYSSGSGPQLRGLVVIDPPAYDQPMPGVVSFFASTLLSRCVVPLLPKRLLARIGQRQVFHRPNRIPLQLIDAYAQALSIRGTGRALQSVARGLIQSLGAKPLDYTRIKEPTLILHGEDDGLVPLSSGRRLHRDMPGSSLVVIPDCGHAPQEEKPEEAATALLNFLSATSR